jgi:CRP/FNR family transcriptional regulator
METLPSTRELRVLQLKPLPLFRALADADLRRLADAASLRRYLQEETLFRQGTSADAFFVILDGAVQVTRAGAGGREQVLHVFGPGNLVGEVPAFRGGEYPASGLCAQEARVLWIPRSGLVKVLRETPEMALALLAGVCERLRVFVELVDGLALKDVSGRLADYLLRLRQEQQRDVVDLPTTKAALATMLGTVPETLSRRLRSMQQDGLVSVQGRRIQLLDHRGLRALADV